MKRIFVICLAALLCMTMFSACASGENGSSGSAAKDELVEGTKLSDIVDKIDQEIGIAMAGEVTQEMLSDMYGIDDTMAEDFYGKYAQVMPGVDDVVIVKAKEGKIEDVKAALEKRKEARIAEQYLPDMISKAEAGKVVTKGDYAALLIVGDTTKDISEEIDKAEEIFLSFFA